jgi:hypothetical protein
MLMKDDKPKETEEAAEKPEQEPVGEAAANKVEDLPEWAQRELREARSDAAKYRTSAKELQERISGLKTSEEVEAALAEYRDKAEKAEAEAKAVKDRAAVRGEFKALPDEAFDFVPQGTVEEMRAAATKLAALFPDKPAGTGKLPRGGGGMVPGDAEPAFDVDKFIKGIPRY